MLLRNGAAAVVATITRSEGVPHMFIVTTSSSESHILSDITFERRLEFLHNIFFADLQHIANIIRTMMFILIESKCLSLP